jgi:beta-glucosidase
MEEIREKAQEILGKLSVQEKASLLSQVVWETTNVKELDRDLNKFLLADGPVGIRRLKEYFDEDIYNTKPSTCYPSVSAYASSWNRELVREIGQHIAIESHQEDVDTMLAPAVNLKRSPLGGRNFEYYSEDPYLTSELATEYILGMQEEGIGSCLKHFAVNNQETRRMNINTIVDETTLHEVYLQAFEKPVRVGKPKMVMTAYNQINGDYCASNPDLLATLRDEWGFDGVVVTDCFAAHDLGQGLRNGLTLQMPGETGERISQRVDELLQAGELTEEQLDEAVLRNIIFSLDVQRNRRQDFSYNREQHHEFARQVAEESMVLLKNDANILPLSENESILVIGDFAISPRFQGGGSSHVNPYRLEKPLEELRKFNPKIEFLQGYRNDASKEENIQLRQEAVKRVSEFDKVVVFVGLPDLIESEGYDRTDLKIPQAQSELIEAISSKNQKIILVLSNGSVIEMPWRNKVAAILEGYLGGEAGGSAIANLLFGTVSPSGKLAETFPNHLEDNPSYLYFPGNDETVVYGEGEFIGYKYYEAVDRPVAYSFGYGLSYTKFEYSAANVDENTGKVQVTIKNIGSYTGKEVIQVYVQRRDRSSRMTPKKLVAFTKVLLNPGEEKSVILELNERTFQRYSSRKHRWETANGEYEFMIGSSVQDIRLTQKVRVKDIPYAITMDSTIGDMIQVKGMYEKLSLAFKEHPESLRFLELTQDDDPLKALSMGSLMTLNTLKRVDATLLDNDITEIIHTINDQIRREVLKNDK